MPFQGRIQDFKLGGAHLKELRRAEGGAKIVGVFRVKNHDFTSKNHIFSNFRGHAPIAPHPPGPAPAFKVTTFPIAKFVTVDGNKLGVVVGFHYKTTLFHLINLLYSKLSHPFPVSSFASMIYCLH